MRVRDSQPPKPTLSGRLPTANEPFPVALLAMTVTQLAFVEDTRLYISGLRDVILDEVGSVEANQAMNLTIEKGVPVLAKLMTFVLWLLVIKALLWVLAPFVFIYLF